MSALELNERQSQALLASIFSAASGMKIKPRNVKFESEGVALKVRVSSPSGTVSYNRAEAAQCIKNWVGQFDEAAAVAIYTTDDGNWLENATRVDFSNIEISNASDKAISEVLAAVSKTLRSGPR